jgi:hypothetical protein
LNEDKQTELSLPAEFLGEAERKGEFTGQRLSERKPEIYSACVRLLAEGCSYLSIAKLLRISVNSVAAVKDREQISIESQKRQLAGSFRLASALASERAIELLSDEERSKEIPLNQLAIATGIFTEKAELLSGGATSRVDWVQPAPAVDDFNSYLDDLRSKAEPIEVEAVDPEDQKENPGTSTAPGEENNRCLSEKTETKGEPVQPGCPDPQGDQESHGKSCGDQ